MSKVAEPLLSECFHRIIGKVCDPSQSGEPYDFTGKIICPNCGSPDVMYYADDSFRFDEINLPNVSHKKWDAMPSDEKVIYLKEKLVEVGCL